MIRIEIEGNDVWEVHGALKRLLEGAGQVHVALGDAKSITALTADPADLPNTATAAASQAVAEAPAAAPALPEPSPQEPRRRGRPRKTETAQADVLQAATSSAASAAQEAVAGNTSSEPAVTPAAEGAQRAGSGTATVAAAADSAAGDSATPASVSADALREILQKLSGVANVRTVKALLDEFGANRISEVKEEDRGKVFAKAEQLIKDAPAS